MSVSSEVKEKTKRLQQLQDRASEMQKPILTESQALKETKEKAKENLLALINSRPKVTSIEAVMDWEILETNIQCYQESVDKAHAKIKKSLEQQERDPKKTSGLFAGLAASGTIAAAGMAAPSAAMALASTFGVASTGTAIASLSGVAATNASLALIGGGSMVAGEAALSLLGPIGLGIGGTVALLTLSKNARKKKKLLSQLELAIDEMQLNIEKLGNIQSNIKKLQNKINSQTERLGQIDTNRESLLISTARELSDLLNTPVNDR